MSEFTVKVVGADIETQAVRNAIIDALGKNDPEIRIYGPDVAGVSIKVRKVAV